MDDKLKALEASVAIAGIAREILAKKAQLQKCLLEEKQGSLLCIDITRRTREDLYHKEAERELGEMKAELMAIEKAEEFCAKTKKELEEALLHEKATLISEDVMKEAQKQFEASLEEAK